MSNRVFKNSSPVFNILHSSVTITAF